MDEERDPLPSSVRVPRIGSDGGVIPEAVEYPLIDFPWEPWTLVPFGRELTQAQAAAYADWLNGTEAGRLTLIMAVLGQAGAPVTGLPEHPERLLDLGAWLQGWFPLVAAPLVEQGFISSDGGDRLGQAWAAWGPPLSNYSRFGDALLHSLAHDVAFIVANCARAGRPGLRWQPLFDPRRQDFLPVVDPALPGLDVVWQVKDFLVQTVARPYGRRGRELRQWYARVLHECCQHAATGVAPPPKDELFPEIRSRLYPRYRLERPGRSDPPAPAELAEAIGAFRRAGWFSASKLADADLARAARAAWRRFERADMPLDAAGMNWRLLLLDTSRTWSEEIDAVDDPGRGLHAATVLIVDGIIGKGVGHPYDPAEDWDSRPGDLLLSVHWGRRQHQLLIPAPGPYLSPALFTGVNGILPAGLQRLWFFDHGPPVATVTRATAAERDALEQLTGLRLDPGPPRWWTSLAPLPPPGHAEPPPRPVPGPARVPVPSRKGAATGSASQRGGRQRASKTGPAPAADAATGQEKFTYLMRDLLGPALHDLGFTGRTRSFRYQADDLEGGLWARKSRYSRQDHVDFTIELWAAHIPTDSGYWSRELPSLMPGNQNYWWRVETGQPAEPVGDDILQGFRGYGWPALQAALDSPGYPPDPAASWGRTFPHPDSPEGRHTAVLTLEPVAALLRPTGDADEDLAELRSEEPGRREIGLSAAVRMPPGPRTLPILLNRLEHDPSHHVRATAALYLGPLAHQPNVRQSLQAAAAEDEDLEVRWQARYQLRLATLHPQDS